MTLELIPQPRVIELKEGGRRLGQLRLAAPPPPLRGHIRALERCLARVAGEPDGETVDIFFAEADLAAQGYDLLVGEGRVEVRAADAAGALYAGRTLLDVWRQTRPVLPSLHISDAPTFPSRGVFVESVWGTDRMERRDWFAFVDQLAQLKFNVLAISLYGCWDLRHEEDNSEFLLVPLDRFPQLRTPHTIHTWSPESGEECIERYLPRMFEGNFYSEVVDYAHQEGLEVIPLIGGPAHSTLLPRMLPDLSARDGEGKPTGYGYCVTSPSARRCLQEVFDNLIQQHVLPNRIEIVGCGGDEYYPIHNVDPSDPLRQVDPRCQCGSCRSLTGGEQLLEYFALVGQRLADHGLRMFHWQDSLVRERVLDEYANQVSARRFPKPVISWWKYQEPLPRLKPFDGIETWVTPAPGMIGTLFHQDRSLNIEAWLREGRRNGASGVVAYTVPDPNLHKGYTCLADLSWNLEGSDGSAGFKRRWAKAVAPDQPEQAAFAYAVGESVLACYPYMTHVLDHLLPYFSTAPRGVTRHPDDLLLPLSIPSPALTSALRQTRDTLREAVELMPPTRGMDGWPDPSTVWSGELGRIADQIELMLRLIGIARRLPTLSPAALEAEAAELKRQGIASMRRIALTKAPYLVPAVLREHWRFLSAITSALAHLKADPARLPSPAEAWHAWLV